MGKLKIVPWCWEDGQVGRQWVDEETGEVAIVELPRRTVRVPSERPRLPVPGAAVAGEGPRGKGDE